MGIAVGSRELRKPFSAIRGITLATIVLAILGLSVLSYHHFIKPRSASAVQPHPDPLSSDAPIYLVSGPAPRLKLLSSSQTRGLISMPWRFVSLSANKTDIRVYYAAGGGCITPVGFQVIETPAAVEIWAWSHKDLISLTCSGEATTAVGLVALSHSLGSRRVYHGQVDKSAPPEGVLSW